MMHAPPDLTLTIAVIAGSGAAAQWLAWRLRWPSIVLMMGAGLILGPLAALALGAPLLDPSASWGGYLRPMIALAVAVILFEGGITLNFRELRDASSPVRRMVLFGFPIGWGFAVLCLHYVAGIAWDIAAMIGALLTTTGPTVVLPLLRQAKLPGRVASVLKWEGIVNDPIGALCAVLIFEAIRQSAMGQDWTQAAIALGMGAAIGAVLGFAFGYGMSQAFRRGWVPESMKAPLVLASVMVCFSVADALASETGLVAVTLFGLVVANARLASIEEMRRFKEGIASILVAAVFVVLAADLEPADLAQLDWRHGAFILVFMLVARPLSVVLATVGSGLNWRETAFVGMIGPRGVVAAAAAGHLAVELMAAGRDDAAILAPLVFATIFATVFGCGFAVAPLAKLLGLSQAGPERLLIVGANPWTRGLADALKSAEIPVTIADTSWRRLRDARLAGHDVYYGEVLAEAADWRLEPARFAALLAATPNEAYNALVCIDYAPEMGRSRVFQLSGQGSPLNGGEEDEDPRAIAYTARGRTLIRRGRAYDSLSTDLWKGWRFKVTRLTEDWTMADALGLSSDATAEADFGKAKDFVSDPEKAGDLILERRPNGTISLLGPGKKPTGGPGAILIRFLPPEQTG